MNYIIRQEAESDYEVTERVVKHAFIDAAQSDKDEHNLVSRLRKSESFIPELSLVAVAEEQNVILGHILLSKIIINYDTNQKVESLALAPVSVMPDYQNKGIGKSLIETSLKKAQEMGFLSVIVLGHPDYYPKFGFQKSSVWNIQAPLEVPEEALMAIELQPDSLENVSGLIEYPDVFFE